MYKQNSIKELTNRYMFTFPKKGDLGSTKNYKGITLIYMATKSTIV